MSVPPQVVGIHGVPRSGTSWLGAIFDSSPRVAYRFQPLFSYAFKNRIDAASSDVEIARFLADLAATDDPFVLHREKVGSDGDHGFVKEEPPTHLVMKHVRHHQVVARLLEAWPSFRCVALVRHPCAVIHSWLRAPREFEAGWDPSEEWRFAPKKNQDRPEEWNGFEKWVEATRLFLELARSWPDRVQVVRYADLLARPEVVTRELFARVDLPLEQQTVDFLRVSTTRHSDDPYSVYRARETDEEWKLGLDRGIADAILRELAGDPLDVFLDD